MRHVLALSILIGGLVVGSLACGRGDFSSFTEVRADRAKLIAPFDSYESIQVVHARIKEMGFTWNVLEDNQTVSESYWRPPFHSYVMSIDGFSDLGRKGTLWLDFFNDRLMKTVFYPDDFPAYRAAVEKMYPALQGGASATIAPHVNLFIARDYKERDYIAYEDIRLREQLNLWIRRYA